MHKIMWLWVFVGKYNNDLYLHTFGVCFLYGRDCLLVASTQDVHQAAHIIALENKTIHQVPIMYCRSRHFCDKKIWQIGSEPLFSTGICPESADH